MQTLLETLAGKIQDAEPSSQQDLASIGEALEQAADTLPADCPEAGEVFDLVLKVLQAVYLDKTPKPAAALQAMAGALSAAEAYLASKEDCTRTALLDESQILQQILGSGAEPAISSDATVPSEQPQELPQANLDDAAALLIGLTHKDHDALVLVCDLLSSLLEASALSPEVLDHILQAKQILDRIVSGQIEDAQAAFAQASKDIERAVQLRDTAETSESVLGIPQDAQAEQEPIPAPADVRMNGAGSDSPTAETTQRQADTEIDPEHSPTLPAEADPELLGEYIVESLDQIQTAEGVMLDLESDPEQSEPVHKVFCAFHTIKVTSGFLNLELIQRLAHLAENLLDRACDGKIRLTGGYADLALESCDMLKDMIAGLEGLPIGDSLPIPDKYSNLIENLTDPEAAGFSAEVADDDDDSAPTSRIGDILVAQGKAERQDVEVATTDQGATPVGETLLKFGAVKASDVAKAIRTQKRLRRQCGN